MSNVNEKRISVLKSCDLKFNDTTAKGRILKLIKEGKNCSEIVSNLSDIKPQFVTTYIKRMYDSLNLGTQKPENTVTTKTETKTETKSETKSDFTDSNRNKLIPSPEKYISRKVAGTTDVLLMESAYNSRQNILVIGDTGSGKTMLLRHIASKLQVPYMRVNLNGATTPEDLVGQYIPNTDPNVNSKYVWKDGVLTDFMRHGGIFVVDEINMCPADILSILHSVTDDERKIVLTQRDGEVIEAHKDFWIVSTMNPDYEGTKPLNIALKDRFRTVFLSYNPTVEKQLCKDEKFLEIVTQLRKSDQISTPVSTRDIIKYRDDCEVHSENVAQYFFINNFENNEQPVVSEIIELCMNPSSDVSNDENARNEY